MKERRSKETKLLATIRSLELRLEATEGGIYRIIPSIYLTELATLTAIAYSGIRRPDDIGYTPQPHAESRSPVIHRRAGLQLEREVAELKARARNITSTLHQIDPGAFAVDAVEGESTFHRQISGQTKVRTQ